MTMFEFMQNAFFLLCGIACIALAVLIVNGVIVALSQSCRKNREKKNAGYRFDPEIQKGRENGRNQDRRGNA